MELEGIRSFRKTSQNTFEYIPACDLKHSDDEAHDTHHRKIRPTVYKTFIKMRSTEKNAKVKVSFIRFYDMF